jgi:tetratricopeptide (TPR) repeat protein
VTLAFSPDGLRRLRSALERAGVAADWPENENEATQAVTAALKQLPERWRAIVLRCDLGRELHRAVATDLGISKRHLYRERLKALHLLSERFASARALPAIPKVVTADIDVAVSGIISNLFNTQSVGKAVPILEAALRDVARPGSRIRLLMKLCDVHCQLGTLNKADNDLFLAYQTFESSTFDVEETHTLRLELAEAESNLLRYRQDPSRAEQRLVRAIRYCVSIGISGVAVNRALAKAQVALANLLGTRDRYVAAVGYASEADRIIGDYPFDMPLRSRVMTQLATMRFFGGVTPAQVIVSDLKSAFSVAQTNGFAVDMIQAATVLSFLHSFAGDHDEAIAYARTVVNIADAGALRGAFVTGARYALASTQVAAGHVGAAMENLQHLYALQAKDGDSGFPFTKFLESQVLYAGRHYYGALRAAQAAVVDLERSQNIRSQGAAFEVRAAIEDRLGERRRAQESVDIALALLERGAPAGLLARAYERSARLTGNTRHRVAARALREIAVLPA